MILASLENVWVLIRNDINIVEFFLEQCGGTDCSLRSLVVSLVFNIRAPWCWSDCTLFPHQCCTWHICAYVMSPKWTGFWAEQFRALLWSLHSDQLWHPLLSPLIVIPLLVLGQEVWGRKVPRHPGRSLRSSWPREEQVRGAWAQMSPGTQLAGQYMNMGCDACEGEVRLGDRWLGLEKEQDTEWTAGRWEVGLLAETPVYQKP